MTDPVAPRAVLAARDISRDFGNRRVLDGVDLDLIAGTFTAIVGANGSGKSTLLRVLARVLKPSSGEVLLDGQAIRSTGSRAVARRMALLPQSPRAPEGITVGELVERGRHPHRGAFARLTSDDVAAIEAALVATHVDELVDRPLEQLSGGQRQRAWLAMVLAQATPTVLLDEPTTWLDLAHQSELLELCEDLVHRDGRTLVLVLHDLNQAARYADCLVVLREGRVIAHGPPVEVLDAELVERAFGLACRIVPDPETRTPMVVPRRSNRR